MAATPLATAKLRDPRVNSSEKALGGVLVMVVAVAASAGVAATCVGATGAAALSGQGLPKNLRTAHTEYAVDSKEKRNPPKITEKILAI